MRNGVRTARFAGIRIESSQDVGRETMQGVCLHLFIVTNDTSRENVDGNCHQLECWCRQIVGLDEWEYRVRAQMHLAPKSQSIFHDLRRNDGFYLSNTQEALSRLFLCVSSSPIKRSDCMSTAKVERPVPATLGEAHCLPLTGQRGDVAAIFYNFAHPRPDFFLGRHGWCDDGRDEPIGRLFSPPDTVITSGAL